MGEILECTGDDPYVLADSVIVPPPRGLGGGDVFSSRNLDGTAREVPFVAFTNHGLQRTYLYAIEWSEIGVYAPLLIDSALAAAEKYASSVCADVDGDSIEEVFWSCGTHVRAYRMTSPHQFEQIWYWSNQDSTSCNLTADDVNGNGYKELIISGSGRTFLYEVEAVTVVNPDTSSRVTAGDTCVIRWRVLTPPRCDSVSLFLRTDTAIVNGFYRLDTIAPGLSPNESAYVWIVPDTTLDSARILAIAYGPGWQFDESDRAVSIGPAGVAEQSGLTVTEWSLAVGPNPAVGAARLSYSVPVAADVRIGLFDVSGRQVVALANGVRTPGGYLLDVRLPIGVPPGIYFVRMDAPGYSEQQKLILLR